MKLKRNNIELLTDGLTSFFAVQEYKDILRFAVEDIDLSGDVSADKDRVDLINYPYIVEPLTACTIQKGLRKQVVIAFPEQMGKSLIQIIALLHAVSYNELQAIVMYPSLQLAVQTSTVKFIPLVRKLKQFEEELDMPFAVRNDRLKLSNALIYWQGAGSKAVSRSCKLCIADEASIYETPNNVDNLQELKKRTRSYQQCLQLFISTPRYKQDPFWRQFLQGSQGFYYLRCQNCGELTIRSCDTSNLQFQTVYNQELRQYIAVPGSERLICPKCHFEHGEDLRPRMIKEGGYIHSVPEKVKAYPTFQAGVLASLLNVHEWGNIANTQLASGKQASLEDYISYDNSIRGLPYQQREYNKQGEKALERLFYAPEDLRAEDIEAVYIAADTQDTFSPCAVIALTRENKLYVQGFYRPRYLFLDEEERRIINAENKRNGKPPEMTLTDLLDREFWGMKPLCLFVDMRGHRTAEIKGLAKLRKNALMYGGTSLKYEKWKVSDNDRKLFLCDAKKYQAELIFELYFNKNKRLFLPSDLTEKDIEEITSFQPDNEKRNGQMYENWDCKDKVHDLFDVLKMGLAIVEISARIYRPDKFRFGEAKCLQRQKRQVDERPKEKRPVIRRSLLGV